MFDDLGKLITATALDRSYSGYREELDAENVLGKHTGTNRTHTARKLKALYGLDPSITVFRLLRHFWDLDSGEGRPGLALLCATARDPLLRSLTPLLLNVPPGQAVQLEPLEHALRESSGDRFTDKTIRASVRNAAKSWKTSGHLEGRQRIRTRPRVTPALAAYAFALGYLEGRRGNLLFGSLWAQLLDRRQEELRDLAGTASQNGWIVYRGIGDVIEIRFPELWTPAERELLNEQT